jgi:hypothetical protein
MLQLQPTWETAMRATCHAKTCRVLHFATDFAQFTPDFAQFATLFSQPLQNVLQLQFVMKNRPALAASPGVSQARHLGAPLPVHHAAGRSRCLLDGHRRRRLRRGLILYVEDTGHAMGVETAAGKIGVDQAIDVVGKAAAVGDAFNPPVNCLVFFGVNRDTPTLHNALGIPLRHGANGCKGFTLCQERLHGAAGLKAFRVVAAGLQLQREIPLQ